MPFSASALLLRPHSGGQPPGEAVLQPSLSQAKCKEGKPVFLFRSSVGYFTTVVPQSLSKMGFSFAFFFLVSHKDLHSSKGGKAEVWLAVPFL